MNTMQKLFEFYEMVSVNDGDLSESEKTAILKATLALSMFNRAMNSFKRASTGQPAATGSWFRMAA